MKPVGAFATAPEAKSTRGLLFDLDDTVLTKGVLTRVAYDALWDLRQAGIPLVAVTGRPSGWGEVIARQWPIAGCVTENGAISVVHDEGRTVRRDPCGEEERALRRRKLADVIDAVRERVPEARLTDDVGARVSDVTWDIGEHAVVPRDRIDLIARTIVGCGARTTRSSVHIHATFDVEDKASGALRFLREQFAEDAGRALVRWAFVGDSANDAACFAAFRTTFGVANVRAHLREMSVPPRYVADEPMGAGFASVARALLNVLGGPRAAAC